MGIMVYSLLWGNAGCISSTVVGDGSLPNITLVQSAWLRSSHLIQPWSGQPFSKPSTLNTKP